MGMSSTENDTVKYGHAAQSFTLHEATAAGGPACDNSRVPPLIDFMTLDEATARGGFRVCSRCSRVAEAAEAPPAAPVIDEEIPRLASVAEVAALLEVSKQTVNAMINGGRLPACRVGGTWVVRWVVAEAAAAGDVGAVVRPGE